MKRAVPEIEVCENPQLAAERCASIIAELSRTAGTESGVMTLALSGGTTPERMFRILAQEDVPWTKVHLFQVDERIASAGHRDRNLTSLRESLVDRISLPEAHLHPMPVEAEDPEKAIVEYSTLLREVAGSPPVLDVVHLGIGADGHTASLVPDDRVLDVTDRDFALTGFYSGRRRLTMTYPVLNRARNIVWLVTGPDKAAPLAKLMTGDRSIPAGLVRADQAIVIADRAAAGQL